MSLNNPPVPISKFLPRVAVHIDGADESLVETFITDAIIEFSRDSHILSAVQCISLDCCTTSYAIHPQYRISEILHVRLFSHDNPVPSDTLSYRVVNNVLYVDNPVDNITIELEYSQVPFRDSGEVPELFYEDWLDAIVSLALMKLYLLTDNEWYNPTAANNRFKLYTTELRKAKVRKITKHKPLKVRLVNSRRHR